MPLFKQDASFFDGDPNEGDLSKAPPGVPQNFYDSARKQLTAFEDQLKRLPGGAGSEAAQQARNQFYANIQKMWDEFPAEDKAAYIEAQAAGNPHDPLSVEGRQWSANKETSDVRSDNAAVFDEFLEDSLPGIKDTIAAATAGDEAAYAQLEQLLNGIQDL